MFLQINYTIQENCLDLENWQNILWFLDTNHTVTCLEGRESINTLSQREKKKEERKWKQNIRKILYIFYNFLIDPPFISMRLENMNSVLYALKESACQCRRCCFDPCIGKISWNRQWWPTPVFSPGKIPWTEEPGGLWSIGWQRIRHGWA